MEDIKRLNSSELTSLKYQFNISFKVLLCSVTKAFDESIGEAILIRSATIFFEKRRFMIVV